MALSPTLKKRARERMADYCVAAEGVQAIWHYSQRRPYTGLGRRPDTSHIDDCSAYVALVYYDAQRKIGHGIADPLAEHYSGYGNTQTSYEFLNVYKAPKDKYRIGDVAIYGTKSDTKHMTVCRKAGDRSSSVWSSFGQESGPQPERLHYRDDLVGVYRHPALR